MPSLKAGFDELMERVRQGREFGHASFEPVYYLIFPPREILEVKRMLGDDYVFVLSPEGRKLAAERALSSRYAGPAPVSLKAWFTRSANVS